MKRGPGPLCKGELRQVSSFGPHGTRLQCYCRDCNNRGYRQKRRSESEMSTPMSVPIIELEPDLEFDRREASVESDEPPRKRRRQDSEDVLYVMEIDFGCQEQNELMREMCGLKIGRSWDTDKRAQSLARSMPFMMKILAEFPGCAHIEHDVHEALSDFRNTKGPGREWFHVPFGRAVEAIGSVMQRSSKHANGPGTSTASGR